MVGFLVKLAGVEYEIEQLAFKASLFSAQVDAKATVIEIKGDEMSCRMNHISGDMGGRPLRMLFPEGIRSKRVIVDLPIAELMQKMGVKINRGKR